MKRFWWSWILVFFLGMAIGRWDGGRNEAQGADVPSFTPPLQSQVATVPPVAEPEPTVVPVGSQQETGLPQNLQYTSLVAQKLVCYDGPYLEDGSDEELIGVTALLLENTGTIGIEYARVTLVQGGRELVFDATYLPPRGKVLVLEKYRAEYRREEVSALRCRVLIPGTFDWAQDQVQVQQGEGFSMVVTNLTDKTLPFVRIFYKGFDGPSDTNIGGITLSAVIPQLQPGESREVTPYHYAGRYSSIVAVVVDE